MRILRGMVPVALLAGLVFGTGCETSQPKRAAASLPSQAKAPEIAGPVAQPADPKPKIQPQVNPTPDPAEALIAQAEKQYAAGQANYQADHLEAARQNFDQAFNTLLSSNLAIRNDERLEREFDKIVEAVHELEMAALKQGCLLYTSPSPR